ncbi:hypothetical protein FNU76_04460 [Chitinimonas arctica]|uniref:Pilus assembly protein PilO n=1 Tax=Chitinimonas arctica TaxID=2594795 RepID=A0A516SBY9_9NEIS|nr:GspMb/PilO family protein [Chitinimonas arctica]QDQ25662.1 hypothetical protein FNU76_04460 [Chitinimonas arctica]
MPPLLSRYRFQARRLLYAQPRLVAALGLAVLAFLLALATHIRQGQLALETAQTWQASQPRTMPLVAKPTDSAVVLPAFESKQLLGALNRAADQAKLPLDELSFTLDDSANQPYLRYRASLTLLAGYPAVRRFLAGLQAGQPNIVIDGVQCSREDIGLADLSCEATISAFYRKPSHG